MAITMEALKWPELRRIQTSCEEKTFMKAIEIWLLKPQVVNRRLAGAVVLQRTHINDAGLANLIEKCSTSTFKDDGLFENLPSSDSDDLFYANTVETLEGENPDCSCANQHLADEISQFELCVRKLVPRVNGQGSTEETLNEIVIIDHGESSATFVSLQDDGACEGRMFKTAYKIVFSRQTSSISLQVSRDYREPQRPSLAVTCPTKAWLQDCLLPKIAKWASEVSADAPLRRTQALVSMERYSTLYRELKKKYGTSFVKIWPENTDPLKFVYEDVAIATYLLVLWEQERAESGLESRQSFVDLGCGNGLLVHILNSEGHPGKGIDLRRRKIWDLYGPGTNLEECSITPSDDFLFPDYDWLIGNHSDELTPWIPVMAARSSYTTRYFVLPCCFHDFDVKFMRSDQTKTQYRAYLDFVEEVGRVCGFSVQEDTLRIPSTKRICQIGSLRDYQPEQMEEIHERISDYIASRPSQRTSPTHYKDVKQTGQKSSTPMDCVAHEGDAVNSADASTPQAQSLCRDSGNQSNVLGTDMPDGDVHGIALSAQWAPRFQPREKMEPVRNCARVDYDLKERIVKEVACAILKEEGVDFTDGVRGPKEKKVWRRGGSLTFAEIVKLFDSDTLKHLKSECGGLKTLLRNSHQVFQVLNNKVEIRDWSACSSSQQTPSKKPKRDSSHKMQSFKTRLCWFHTHHPDGCPRLASECQFAHGDEELRESSVSTR